MQQAIADAVAEATEAKAKYAPLQTSVELARQEAAKFRSDAALWESRYEEEKYSCGEMRKRNAACSNIESEKNLEIKLLQRELEAARKETEEEKQLRSQAEAKFETAQEERNKFEAKELQLRSLFKKEEGHVLDLRTEVERLRVYTNEDAALKSELAKARAEAIHSRVAVEEAEAKTAFVADSVEAIKDKGKQNKLENEIMRSELQSGHDFRKELEKRLVELTKALDEVCQERDDLLERLATVSACEACNLDLSYWVQDCSPNAKNADKQMDKMLTINDDDEDFVNS